jgi:hypothetical protein
MSELWQNRHGSLIAGRLEHSVEAQALRRSFGSAVGIGLHNSFSRKAVLLSSSVSDGLSPTRC